VRRKKGKKKRILGLHRKRMKRPARLLAARAWLAGWRDKDILRGYARWFGVDLLCAIKELGLLGVELDADRVDSLRRTFAARKPRKRHRSELSDNRLEGYGEWWDEHFSFIAGRTSGGAAYGVRWEDVEEDGKMIAELGRG
jgi:hypothetical protein